MVIKPKSSQMTRSAANDEIPDKLPVKAFKKMTRHRSYVLYGNSGTGKTTLSCSFPGKILLLDVKDHGTDSVLDIPEDIAVGMPINEWDDIEMVYYYLKKHSEEYSTVVIDTMTQLQQLAVEKVLADQKKSTKNAGNWGTMRKKDWGEVASLMKEWITSYRDLNKIGIEVVFIAQERIFNQTDEEDEVSDNPLPLQVGARLSPSIMAHLNAAVNVIGQTFIRKRIKEVEVNGKKKEVEKMQYCLRIGPDSLYITKARKPKAIELRSIIINPDYDKIIQELKGE